MLNICHGRWMSKGCTVGLQGTFLFYLSLEGETFIAVSYKKLWKLLIDKDIKKKDLCVKAGISTSSVTKMGKNGHVTTEIFLKVCTALDCQIEDIVEFVPGDK